MSGSAGDPRRGDPLLHQGRLPRRQHDRHLHRGRDQSGAPLPLLSKQDRDHRGDDRFGSVPFGGAFRKILTATDVIEALLADIEETSLRFRPAQILNLDGLAEAARNPEFAKIIERHTEAVRRMWADFLRRAQSQGGWIGTGPGSDGEHPDRDHRRIARNADPQSEAGYQAEHCASEDDARPLPEPARSRERSEQAPRSKGQPSPHAGQEAIGRHLLQSALSRLPGLFLQAHAAVPCGLGKNDPFFPTALFRDRRRVAARRVRRARKLSSWRERPPPPSVPVAAYRVRRPALPVRASA